MNGRDLRASYGTLLATALVLLVILCICIGLIPLSRLSEEWTGGITKEGVTLRRIDTDRIRVSWGTGSGWVVSAGNSLRIQSYRVQGALDESDDSLQQLFSLDRRPGVWMFIVRPEDSGIVYATNYVNPRLPDAVDRMFQMLALCRVGNTNTDSVTRLASESYVFLGYVVMDEEDVVTLNAALKDRIEADLDRDISLGSRALYRIRKGVERHYVADPNSTSQLNDARRRIAILFENMNARAGHPCDSMHVLYLDGHIEVIPFGQRFPAVPSFFRAIEQVGGE